MISLELESAGVAEGSAQIPLRPREMGKPRELALPGFCVNSWVPPARCRIDQLPDQDSNLEQTGYVNPPVSKGNGLSHHPPTGRRWGRVWGARGWLIGWVPHQLVSAPSRLRFTLRRAWLRIAATRSAAGSLNSPHFPLAITDQRCQLDEAPHESHRGNLHRRGYIAAIPLERQTRIGCIPLLRSRIPSCHLCDGKSERQGTDYIHTDCICRPNAQRLDVSALFASE
jgi:hypothetical protein